jgi:hypothetical protein
MAPETCRLAAAWNAAEGNYPAAADQAARAAALYAPLRSRFPDRPAAALGEQAAYVLRESADHAARAAALLKAAIDALPVIQTQKYAELAAPFRRQLSFAQFLMGQIDAGLATLRLSLPDEGAGDDTLRQSAQALLQMAQRSGWPADQIDRVRGELCRRWPALCGD